MIDDVPSLVMQDSLIKTAASRRCGELSLAPGVSSLRL